MDIHPVPYRDSCAEGVCAGLPYDTDLVSINGVSIHFWIGGVSFAEGREKVFRALTLARRHRDIVRCTYSDGIPAGFWAHEHILGGKTAEIKETVPA